MSGFCETALEIFLFDNLVMSEVGELRVAFVSESRSHLHWLKQADVDSSDIVDAFLYVSQINCSEHNFQYLSNNVDFFGKLFNSFDR